MEEINNVRMKELTLPNIGVPQQQPIIPDGRYAQRLSILRAAMHAEGLNSVVIYADREHYANFKYYVGFEPRFEEGILIVHLSDPSYIILGNECCPMHRYAKLKVKPLLSQALSLPGQPMDKHVPLDDLFRTAGIEKGRKIGIIGWKYFTDAHGDFLNMFDLPAFILDALKEAAGRDELINATGLLINPDTGLRTISSADEIAVFEYGAAWASVGVHTLLQNIRPGMTEQQLAEYLITRGMQQSCHPMCLGGSSVDKGMISPSTNVVQRGDPFIVSIGLEGGLTCREGYLVENVDELPEVLRGYIEEFAKPYYAAIASWYSTIGIGVTGGELYYVVDQIIPKKKFGWALNPGHLIGIEEWLSSAIAPGSEVTFKSGMTVQMDIIPRSDLYCGVNAEDGVALADETLRNELAQKHPATWNRIQARRKFMAEELGIVLKPEVLPLSNMTGIYCPLLMRPSYGFVMEK